MKVLFVNTNLYGHINPTLGLVKKLAERKNLVDYFCAEPFSKLVAQAGARWVGFGEGLNGFLKAYRPTDKHPFYTLMEYLLSYDEAALPEILGIARRGDYDLILCDSFFGGGCFLKEILPVPVASSHSSFAASAAPVPARMLAPGFHPQLDHCYAIRKRICESYGVPEPSMERIFIGSGERNLVYTTREFNGEESLTEPEYLFVGPCVNRAEPDGALALPAPGEGKLIYISLGSLNTDFAAFFKTCIAAFGERDERVCLSVGEKCDLSQLGEAPGNFTVKRFFPQLRVLRRADAFITHAGFNSANEALYFGVPTLSLPQMNDQYRVAKRLSTLRLGVAGDMGSLTPEALYEKTEALLCDEEIRRNCHFPDDAGRRQTGARCAGAGEFRCRPRGGRPPWRLRTNPSTRYWVF